MNKCPNCGASSPLKSFVCDYCGYVESKRVKQINKNNAKQITFDDSLNIIRDNLDALHDINKPTIKSGIMVVLRVIVAIHTIGISLIFWRKPKKRFDKKSYNSLKRIIERNISFLKISSKGSTDLLNRIEVVEKELEETDIKIEKSHKAKRITIFLTIGAYISLIIINNALNPVTEKNIYSFEENVSGDLKDTLSIVQKVYKLRYQQKEYIKNIKLDVYVMANSLRKFQKNEDLEIYLQLTDSLGNPSKYFSLSKPDNFGRNEVIRDLKRGKKQKTKLLFKIYEKKELKIMPSDITNFRIITKIIEKAEKQ